MSQRSLDDWEEGSDAESAVTDGGERLPGTCLSFEISGEWGHFRRVEGNIVKQSYRIVPRTTVAGIVAAMLGLERDSYYGAFGPEVSAIAVEPTAELRTMNVPQNTLSTAKEHMTTVPSRGHARVSLPDPSELRQQHNYELLVEPSYRIDLRLADDRLRERLHERLREGTSYYPPSLGLSEHLAEVEFLGEFDVTPHGPETVDVSSAVVEAVDDVELTPGAEVRVERSPAYMRADADGRTTSEFHSIAYTTGAEPLRVQDVQTHEVDGRRVMFA